MDRFTVERSIRKIARRRARLRRARAVRALGPATARRWASTRDAARVDACGGRDVMRWAMGDGKIGTGRDGWVGDAGGRDDA